MEKLFPILIVLVTFLTGGCSAIESIFETGVWAGVITVIIVLLGLFIVFKLIKRASKKKGKTTDN